jgi:hypothetical protein
MRVRFLRDFDFIPSRKPGVTIAYRAGSVFLVTRECGQAAIKAGAAEKANVAATRRK